MSRICQRILPVTLLASLCLLLGCGSRPTVIRYEQIENKRESARIAVMSDGTKVYDGAYTTFDEYGNLNVAGSFRAGNRHGVWTEWLELVQLLVPFRNNENVGIISVRGPDEKVITEVPMKQGFRHDPKDDAQIIEIARVCMNVMGFPVKSGSGFRLRHSMIAGQIAAVHARTHPMIDICVIIDCAARRVLFFDYSKE